MKNRSLFALASTATAALLVVGSITGAGATAGSSPEPRPLAHVRSAEFATASDVEEFEPGDETLSSEEISDLSEGEVEQILEVSEEAVTDAQEQFEEEVGAADYERALAAYEQLSAQLDQIIAAEGVEGLTARFPEEASTAAASAGMTEGFTIMTAAKRCLTVYKWQLQTIAWIAIGYGAFVSIAALFAGAVTIVGLPAGAVVAALGITLGTVGSYFLWKVDQQRWNSKRVCF